MVRLGALLLVLVGCKDSEARRQLAELRATVESQDRMVTLLHKQAAERDLPKRWACTADPADRTSGSCFDTYAECEQTRVDMANQGSYGYVDCYGQDEASCVSGVTIPGGPSRRFCCTSLGACDAMRRALTARGHGPVSTCDRTR